MGEKEGERSMEVIEQDEMHFMRDEDPEMKRN